MYTIREINDMSQESFIESIGPIFEHSPWIAERTWHRGPFEDKAALLEALQKDMYRASEAEHLSLLRAHPDLGTKMEVTSASRSEQQGAGLDQLTTDEYDALTRMNEAYKERFAFPFILAVKGKTKQDILTDIERRRHHTLQVERDTALREVAAIASFRLEALVADSAASRQAGMA
ncbi:2-oxo-4-hydroxy-4-carboxy-5-ureidoimidazoline decarboxylase [Alkalicoccus chagannorensis]|uniref:2-oxo-4-hydroxy-4-carboxy-5-ureidoimidazoline decarboxylase n=1 Tax=Alkalicoccus chagannorensis TaxID=427072 RepID=UPI0004039F87|nr:2-oxo-4-hydroxy-4-carboxy-5-ureidoimidazoline decarboxylase [Alkalicoccus chagannorensis]